MCLFIPLSARLRILFCLLLVCGIYAPSRAQTLGPEGLVPDSTELRVLRQFYYATGGPTWNNRTNWLTGNTLAEAGTWFGVTVANGDVTALVSSNNNLQGMMPASLGQLTQLTALSLTNARGLVGPIPRELGNLRKLQSLRFVTTSVSGSIPAELGQLTNLTTFTVFNAKLSGIIPPSLGNLVLLREFNLGNYFRTPLGEGNQFSGGIPASLGQLTQATYFEISAAPVGGPIPPELGNLINLTYLELDNCQLTGPIPTSLSQLTQLQYLQLDHNLLAGAVPPGLTQLTQLSTLLLSDNQLTDVPSWVVYYPRRLPNIDVRRNYLNYAAIERQFFSANTPLAQYQFAPQRTPPGVDTTDYVIGDTLKLAGIIGGDHNRYQWERRIDTTWTAVAGATSATLRIAAASAAEQGIYRTRVTSDWIDHQVNPTIPDIWLYSKMVYAKVKAKTPCVPLTLTASPNVSIPTGDAVVLRAYPSQAGATLQWSPATGLSTSIGAAVTAAPTVTTTYTVTATTTGACPASTQATVRVTVTPPLALNNPPVDGCAPTLLNTPPLARPAGVEDAVNYVRTYTARAAFTDPAALRAASVDEVQVKTEYLDGLGRPVQAVLRQESPGRRDIVQPLAYDALGRQPRQYLPYAASATPDAVGYYPHAVAEQYTFYRETPIGPGFATDNIARTGVPFSETVFDASPLNRVREQAAPGEAWRLGAEHTVSQEQRPNTAVDAIPRYTTGYDLASTTLTYEGAYPAGELWLTESRDERGFRTHEFKDKQGQVVAKRVECPPPTQNTPGQATPTWLTTLYIYDDFNRLRTVVPPKAFVRLPAANWQVTGTIENLLFRYRYDARGRVVGKNVPGQIGETQLVYDQLDRPILSQDPEQRGRREWAFTKYDALGRVVLTGLVRRNISQATAQTEANNWLTPGTPQYTAQNRLYEQRTANATYSMRITTQQAYPPMSIRGFLAGPILTATYYDDYDYDQNGQPDVAFDAQFNAQFTSGPPLTADLRTTGMPTRTKTRVLSALATDPNLWLTVTTFYDEKARPVQVRSTNARGGEDIVTTQLDFTGKVIKSYATHTGPNHEPLAVTESFKYDHAGRLKEARQQLPGETQPVLIAEPRYNELGQLINKTLAPGTALQQRVDFAYNIRGWLTHVNDPVLSDPTDLWGMQLSYDCGFQESQYTGNIAGQKWRAKSDNIERAYGYLYDGASRLLQGDFVARNAATQAWTAERQRYGLSGMRYDENGNILGLQRRGLLAQATRTAPAQFGASDNLSYTYTGNRLTRVDDAVSTNGLARTAGYQGAPTSLAGDFQEEGVRQAGEYTYDNNGNLTKDANKRITAIVYNHLNLPRRIVFGTGADSIVFRYTAAGQKVLKRVYQTGKPLVQTDYLGAFQYEADSLRFFPHAEGRVLRRVQFDAANQPLVSYRREYSLKDHLGNLRVAYKLGQRATYTATMEADPTSRARREEQQWDSLSIASTRTATPLARGQQYAARLNAALGKPLGPTKLLTVQKGDTVTFTAPGLYQQTVRNTSFGFSLPGFVASLLLQPAPAPVVGPDGRPKPRALPFLGIGLGLVPALTQTGRIPKGYARVLVYNQDSVLVNSYTQQLSAAALNTYEPLRLQVIAPSAGYMTAYVGNESDVDVFFDEVQLDYGPAMLVQENQYDPWGLSLAGLDKAGGLPANRYQYNGKEKQSDLCIGWSDYGARMYDAQLGKWHNGDMLAELEPDISPYSYVGNNPMNNTDIGGTFRMTADMQRKYPYLTKLLKEVTPQIANNPIALATLVKYSGYSKSQIIKSATWGNGPQITEFSNGNGFSDPYAEDALDGQVMGYYNNKAGNETLHINNALLLQLEKYAKNDRISEDGASYKFMLTFIALSTIFHESIHKARSDNKMSERILGNKYSGDGEVGDVWEKETFGFQPSPNPTAGKMAVEQDYRGNEMRLFFNALLNGVTTGAADGKKPEGAKFK